MIQHFYENNMSSLSCQPKAIKERISRLTDENIADIKSLPSITKYLKASNEVANGGEELSDKEFMVRIVYLRRSKRIAKIIATSNARIPFKYYVIQFTPLKNFNVTVHHQAV